MHQSATAEQAGGVTATVVTTEWLASAPAPNNPQHQHRPPRSERQRCSHVPHPRVAAAAAAAAAPITLVVVAIHHAEHRVRLPQRSPHNGIALRVAERRRRRRRRSRAVARGEQVVA
eukprot:COSAG01_NODE_6061_length_3874_cov_1.743379_2_plen_117_part_00